MVELRIKIINTVIIQIGITSNTEVLFFYNFFFDVVASRCTLQNGTIQ